MGYSDSGSTYNAVPFSSIELLTDLVEDTSKTVLTPTQDTMTSSLRGNLKLKTLPPGAREAYVFKDMTIKPLLSTGVLCDAGCKALYEKNKLTVFFKDRVVLTGYRDPSTDGLWMVDLDPKIGRANAVYPTGTKAKLVAFYHACMCSPTPFSMIKAAELGLSFPGVSLKDLIKYKHVMTSAATAKGHLRGTRFHTLRHNLHTSPPDPGGSEGDTHRPTEGEDMPFDGPDTVIMKVFDPSADSIHGDLTGKFPVDSRDGYKYILVLYSTGGNYIHLIPIKDRTGGAITQA